jgi:hypothetical protein
MARTREKILDDYVGITYPTAHILSRNTFYTKECVLDAMESYHKEKLREDILPTMKTAVAKCNEDIKMYSDPEELQSKLMNRKDLQEAAYANGFLNCFNWIKSKITI